ncbi:MAG: glycosyltransferase, partial [Pseudomonadota bacterium]
MRQADVDVGAPMSYRVTVGLCTRNRPASLDACLKSLRDLAVPEGWDVSFVGVDNSRGGDALPAVEAFAVEAPGPVRSVHVTAPGLVAARNAMLEEALTSAPDWILILDDDELVGPGWLGAYAAFIERFPGFDIVTG